MPRPLAELLRHVESLRFRRRFGLGGDGGLEAAEQELRERAPWHPSALATRAREALPETCLPRPPRALRESALLYQRGEPQTALHHVAALEVPWARVIEGDLSLLLAQPARAMRLYEGALDEFGELADLRARLGRAALETGDAPLAWDHAAVALAANPLLGHARQLIEDAAARLGVPTVRLPLRAPVERHAGKLRSLRKLSPRAAAAWSAWNRAASSPDAGTLPPGSGPHRALLDAWRKQPPRASRFGEHDDGEILQLLRWQDDGLLAAYEWSTGLTPTNAEAYRAERRRAESTLRRFWREGLNA